MHKARVYSHFLCMCFWSQNASVHSLQKLFIVRGKIPINLYGTLKILENVKVTGTTNGWMNSEKLSTWISRIWRPDEDDVSCLLTLDKAQIYVKQEVHTAPSDANTELIIIAGGWISIVQPADVSWNKLFKGHLKTKWME